MSRVVLVAARDRSVLSRYKDLLETMNVRLCPDNIEPRPLRFTEEEGLGVAVLNPSLATAVHGTSVCTGLLSAGHDSWWRCGAGKPDGAFALFRADEDHIELLTDVVGSRTIWYVLTENAFVASTSQRAIVTLLGSYEPNEQAASWMLSSGYLGLGNSWDRRIRSVPVNGRIVIDRREWTLDVSETPTVFDTQKRSEDEWRGLLRECIDHTLQGLNFEHDKWVLSLSGGYDSRGLLLLLPHKEKLRCVTWGLCEAQQDPLGDAYIAARVAEHLGVEHTYYETDLTGEAADVLLTRFLTAGEGRVDHISGYADGFAIWKTLRDDGVHGIVRGDEGFGSHPIRTPYATRQFIGLTTLDDFSNLDSAERLNLAPQQIPEALGRHPDESWETWRDRIYYDFMFPMLMASLTDLKTPYVEVANPLVSREIIYAVRALPDVLRTDKQLFRQIVMEMSPPIPFAKRSSTAKVGDLMKTPGFVRLMIGELDSAHARRHLSGRVVKLALEGLTVRDEFENTRTDATQPALKRKAKRLLPRKIQNLLIAAKGKKTLDRNKFAFRATIVSRMCRMLEEDEALGAKTA